MTLCEGCPFCRIALTSNFKDGEDILNPDISVPKDEHDRDEPLKSTTINEAAVYGNDGLILGRHEAGDAYTLISTRACIAFLDILPLAPGHILLIPREHVETLDKITSVQVSREIGFWLSVLSRAITRVTGCVNFNVVQNNGAIAHQVVPHVHYHIIPRPLPSSIPARDPARCPAHNIRSIFGNGYRDELDPDAATIFVRDMRRQIRHELRALRAKL